MPPPAPTYYNSGCAQRRAIVAPVTRTSNSRLKRTTVSRILRARYLHLCSVFAGDEDSLSIQGDFGVLGFRVRDDDENDDDDDDDDDAGLGVWGSGFSMMMRLMMILRFGLMVQGPGAC